MKIQQRNGLMGYSPASEVIFVPPHEYGRLKITKLLHITN